MKRLKRWHIFIGGILLIGLAFLGELLPSTQAGIGAGQIFIITIGAFMMVASFIRWRIGGALFTMIISIFALEVVLRVAGYAPNYTPQIVAESRQPIQYSDGHICNPQMGCRLNPNAPRDEAFCANPTLPEQRQCIINAQGFYSNTDYIAQDLPSNGYRILTLGDSFTWGASASIGNGWVETLQKGLGQEASIWNVGIAGSATGQAIASAKEFIPLMQPDLVILGFFENDFFENLYPLDNIVRLRVRDKDVFVYGYSLDSEFNPTQLSEQNLFFRAIGQPASQNELEILLRQTSLGALGVNVLNNLVNRPIRDSNEESVQRTRAYLAELNQTVESLGSRLVVLSIPSLNDYPTPSRTLNDFRGIASEVGLEVIDVYSLLNDTHYKPSPEGHWTDEGHLIAGAKVTECVRVLINNGELCN